MNILRKIAALVRRLLRRRPPRRVAPFAGDDNQVYLGLVLDGVPFWTLDWTSAGPCVMRFGRIG